MTLLETRELAELRAEVARQRVILEQLCAWKEEMLHAGVADPGPEPEAPLDGYLILEMENTKLNPNISGNSRAKWYVKQATASTLLIAAVNKIGITVDDVINGRNNYGYIPAPVEVVFTRYYANRAQPIDDDNLPPAWKGYRDGVAATLGISDTPKVFKGIYRQIRTKSRTALEIAIKLPS